MHNVQKSDLMLSDEILLQVRLISDDVDGITLAELARLLVILLSLFIEIMTTMSILFAAGRQMVVSVRQVVDRLCLALDILDIILVAIFYGLGIVS